MERALVPDIEEAIRRAELRLEQYLIAQELTPPGRAAAQGVELQVNASLAMLAYLRFVQVQMRSEQQHLH